MDQQFLNSPEENPKDFQPRFKVLYIVLSMVAALLIGRLWLLQIIQGQELREFSERNRVKEVKRPAPRGLMLDREGRVLVDNLPGFEATISPQYAVHLEKTAEAVGLVLGIPTAAIIKEVKTSKVRNGPFRAVRIKDNLTIDEVYRLKMLRWDHPGLNVNEVIVRHYPLGPNGAQLFGYVSEISKEQIDRYNQRFKGQILFEQGDLIGKQGLEEQWETKVRGIDGLSFVEVDARGREAVTENTRFLGFEPQPEVPGNNLILTIDRDIQEAAFLAMQQQDAIGPRIGGLVAIKSNGEILAWVNTPSFDPNQFATGISSKLWTQLINDPFKPLRNKVIQDHYSPGSIFKPFVALAALEEKVITPTSLINSPYQIMFGRRAYHNHTKTNYGNINVSQALEVSSNIFFYKMGISLGINNIAKYAKALGIGQKTGILLGNEVSGLMPTEEWKKEALGEPWQPGENLSNAIGQGFVLTTPLQMALAYNAIGLEGKLYKPHLVKQVINHQNKVIETFEPELVKDLSAPGKDGQKPFVSPKSFQAVKKGLEMVANGDRGTARWWKVPGVKMAGKTGTVQVRSFSADQIYDKCSERPLNQRHHGWYVAYAPADNPEITVAVLAERACAGSSGGAPVVRDVIKAYMEKYRPEWVQPKKITPPPEPVLRSLLDNEE